MKKIIEKLIILFIVIIILVIVPIVILMKDDNDEGTEEELYEDESGEIHEEEPYDGAFGEVTNGDEYFAVKNILDTYILYVKNINGDVLLNDGDAEDIEETEQEFKQAGVTAIENMLDEEYISLFAITDETIEEKANIYVKTGDYSTDVTYNLVINELYAIMLTYTNTLYFVEFNVNDISSTMLIKVDYDNRTYSLFLSDYIEQNNYSVDMNEENITISDSDITENDNNTFSYNSISDQDLAREYFRIIRALIIIDSDRIYDLLEEEYKEVRFEEYSDFEEYVEEMADKLSNSSLSKYNVETDDENNNIVYKLLDDNDVVYTVNVSNEYILDYSIQLDDYTILSDDYIEAYNSATDEEKVQTDIEMFFKMINTKDYSGAYDLLNDSFKSSNFASLDDFKTYAKENFFDNTTITEVSDISKSGTYYVCTFTAASGSSSASTDETSEETFIVSLGDETEFELSFTVK